MLTFHNAHVSRNFLLSVVVISTSLLIYVVLYKNELLSNLYVLLQVLCFTTPLFLVTVTSSLSLSLSLGDRSPKIFLSFVLSLILSYHYKILASFCLFLLFVNIIKAYTLRSLARNKIFKTIFYISLSLQPCFKFVRSSVLDCE